MELLKKNKKTEVEEIEFPAIVSFKKGVQTLSTKTIEDCVKYATNSTRNLYVSIIPTYVTLNPTYFLHVFTDPA